jgi:predicted DNA-binding transcriptional regulator AlpA
MGKWIEENIADASGDDFLTAKGVGALLKCHPMSVWRFERDNPDFPRSRAIGEKMPRWSRREILDYANSRLRLAEKKA